MRQRIRSMGLAAIILSAAIGEPAFASDWRIDPQASAVVFHSTQTGQAFAGEFKHFSGHISFTPGPSPVGDVRIEIDVASLATGSDDRDKQAQGPAWFATDTAPVATFTASQFRQVDTSHYEASGKLTIKAIQVQIVLPFTLRIGGDGAAQMDGSVVLDRLAFGLGTGPFADPAMVGRQVTVDVHLRATPQGDHG